MVGRIGKGGEKRVDRRKALETNERENAGMKPILRVLT